LAGFQTTQVFTRQIYDGQVGYTINNLPAELGRLATPNKSPRTRSQVSSATKFAQEIIEDRFYKNRSHNVPAAALKEKNDLQNGKKG